MPSEAEQIPADIDRDRQAYRDRVKAVYDMHPKDEDADFEHFLDVQLLWDEGMAERAASYVESEPGTRPWWCLPGPATSSMAMAFRGG
jgi:hypothetical protein